MDVFVAVIVLIVFIMNPVTEILMDAVTAIIIILIIIRQKEMAVLITRSIKIQSTLIYNNKR